MTVCFFMSRCHATYTFRDAKIVQDNETAIVVEYKAMSDGLKKRVTMQKHQIAGWTVSE